MNKTFKVLTIDASRGVYGDTVGSTHKLEELLNKGWTIERETVIPCSSTDSYKGLASIVYILSIDKV